VKGSDVKELTYVVILRSTQTFRPSLPGGMRSNASLCLAGASMGTRYSPTAPTVPLIFPDRSNHVSCSVVEKGAM